MSTDGNLPDLKFPQMGGQGNAIRLSASTLKQHGRNGERRSPWLPSFAAINPTLFPFCSYFENEAVFQVTFTPLPSPGL